MAKKKVKSNKRAKAKIQKAATKKPVVRLTKKELARVRQAHPKRSVHVHDHLKDGKPVLVTYTALIAGEKASVQKGWVWFLTGRNAHGRKYKLGSKPLAKIIADYEANPPTTPEEAAARNLGRD